MKTLLTALLILSLSLPAFARNEAWYQDRHCEGITEHVLPDRTSGLDQDLDKRRIFNKIETQTFNW